MQMIVNDASTEKKEKKKEIREPSLNKQIFSELSIKQFLIKADTSPKMIQPSEQ